MSEKKDILEDPTVEIIDLDSETSQEEPEVEIIDNLRAAAALLTDPDDEVQVLPKQEEPEIEIIDDLRAAAALLTDEAGEEDEAIHRLRPSPSPAKRYVKNSGLNPHIHLDRGNIAVVQLDRNDICRYQEKWPMSVYEENQAKSHEKCQKTLEKEDLKRALDRVGQLKVQKEVAKSESKAKGKKSKGKYPKNIRKIIRKSSLDRAEMSLAPPVASLHTDAPRTSTPKRIGLEELQAGLRHCTQHCQSFYNRNGQPSLDPGTWPDTLSWNEGRKEYRRNYQLAADRFPSLHEQLERPSAYDTVAEPEATESTEEEEIVIPSLDEMLQSPAPSTSGGAKAKPIGVVYPMNKFSSLISHGKKPVPKWGRN